MSDNPSDLRDLVARALDGDLTRAERLTLFTQIGADPAARHTVAEVTGLENDLASFGAAYDSAAPQAAEPYTAEPIPLRRSTRRPAWLRGPVGFPAGLAGGALAAGLLFAAYLGLAPVEQAIDRLDVLAIGFEQKSDLAQWSHEHELRSGGAARLTINVSAENPFHLRLSGENRVDLQVEHRRRGQPPQQDRIGGAQTHYAVLRKPQAGDELVFRNSGPETVRISLAAGEATAAEFHRDMAEAGAKR